MASLYRMALEFNELIAQAEQEAINADANEEEVLQDMISSLGMAMDEKTDNIISYAKQLLIEGNALKAEAKELGIRAKAKERRVETLKGILANAGVKKYESTAGKVGSRKSVATIIDDESAVPMQYTNTVEKVTIDKSMIKKAIQSGVEVKGAHVESRESVTIK